MNEQVRDQYEAFPYPARDAAEEKSRLIAGSPSDISEVDHYLFGGARDWSMPFRCLVAGGGTGDGLIQLAQQLAWRGCPAEIVYLDLSTAARQIAQARATARELTNIRFETGSLLDAAKFGTFDYVDCCGVLHHLPDPAAGFSALASVLNPAGGMGIMVYGRIGRTGVYEAQSALRLLGTDASLTEKIKLARAYLKAIPQTNWLRRNDWIGDHERSDAELVDLLLHSQDRAYSVPELYAELDQAKLSLVSFIESARYAPDFYLKGTGLDQKTAALDDRAKAALSELTAGNMKVHIAYVKPSARTEATRAIPAPAMVPVPHRLDFSALSQAAHAGKPIPLVLDGLSLNLVLPKGSAEVISLIDGKRSMQQIMGRLGQNDWFAFAQRFGAIYKPLHGLNKLLLRKSEQT